MQFQATSRIAARRPIVQQLKLLPSYVHEVSSLCTSSSRAGLNAQPIGTVTLGNRFIGSSSLPVNLGYMQPHGVEAAICRGCMDDVIHLPVFRTRHGTLKAVTQST